MGVASRPIPFERRIVVGVQAAVVTHPLQLAQDLEHVHVPIVKQDLLERTGGCKARPHVSKVNLEETSLSTIVVNLVQDEWKSSGLRACPATVEAADTRVRKSIDHPVESQPAEERILRRTGLDTRQLL